MDGKLLKDVQVDKKPLCAMTTDLRGHLVGATSSAGGKKVYSLPDLRCTKSLANVHDLPAPCFAFVGNCAMSAGADRLIHIVNLAKGAGGGGGGGSTVMCVFVFLLVLSVIAFLTLRIGIKGAALQQGHGEL